MNGNIFKRISLPNREKCLLATNIRYRRCVFLQLVRVKMLCDLPGVKIMEIVESLC